jgi:hypothetical protein
MLKKNIDMQYKFYGSDYSGCGMGCGTMCGNI